MDTGVLKHIREHTWCRIGVSKAVSGEVGVIALRDIPPNIDPFVSFHSHEPGISALKRSEFQSMHPAVQRYVKDFFEDTSSEHVSVISTGMNTMNISFYVNHSSHMPNLRVTHDGSWISFRTTRLIHEGEELFYTYASPPIASLNGQEFFVGSMIQKAHESSIVLRVLSSVSHASFESTLDDDCVWRSIWASYMNDPSHPNEYASVRRHPWYGLDGTQIKTTREMLDDVYRFRNAAFAIEANGKDWILYRSDLIGTSQLLSTLAHEVQHIIDKHDRRDIFNMEMRGWLVDHSSRSGRSLKEVIASHQTMYATVKNVCRQYLNIKSITALNSNYKQATNEFLKYY